MGYIETHVVTHKILRLSAEDIQKIDERKKRRNEMPEPPDDALAFCERLNPCPICGEKPHPLMVGEYGKYSYKMSCTGSPFHISCGNWYRKLYRAGKGWNDRTKDTAQIADDIENEKRWAEKRKQLAGKEV